MLSARTHAMLTKYTVQCLLAGDASAGAIIGATTAHAREAAATERSPSPGFLCQEAVSRATGMSGG